MKMKRFFKKGDLIIIAAVLIICMLLYLPGLFEKSENLTAVVYENGEITHRINLHEVTESYEIEINGGVLLVEKASISYAYADCPDKTCVRTGKLGKAGDTAACVPNKTVVAVIKEKNNSKIDTITY